jgi:8-hydroxy-5-deazaflavin:NADPH oxidoreductase
MIKMLISVIGTGSMGSRLAKELSNNGTELMWGSRDPNRAVNFIEILQLQRVNPVDVPTALEADVIFHTLWFRDLIPWAEKYKETLKGKILVDIVNPFTDSFDDFLLDWGTSAAEELQRIIPQTKVVGAFKNTFAKVFDNPEHEGIQSDVYVTSNDETAKTTVIHLLKGIPFRVLDAGLLKNNRTIERMTLFERELAIRHGHPGYVSFRLFGLKG